MEQIGRVRKLSPGQFLLPLPGNGSGLAGRNADRLLENLAYLAFQTATLLPG